MTRNRKRIWLTTAAAIALAGALTGLTSRTDTPAAPSTVQTSDVKLAASTPENCIEYVVNWRYGARPGDDGFGAYYVRLTEDADPAVVASAEAALKILIEEVTANEASARELNGAQGLVTACQNAYPALR